MKTQTYRTGLLAVLALSAWGVAIAPGAAMAQRGDGQSTEHHGKENADWVKSGRGDMAVPYSSDRMSQDRHSKDKGDQARARLYAHKTMMHNGRKYIRERHDDHGVISFTFRLG